MRRKIHILLYITGYGTPLSRPQKEAGSETYLMYTIVSRQLCLNESITFMLNANFITYSAGLMILARSIQEMNYCIAIVLCLDSESVTPPTIFNEL